MSRPLVPPPSFYDGRQGIVAAYEADMARHPNAVLNDETFSAVAGRTGYDVNAIARLAGADAAQNMLLDDPIDSIDDMLQYRAARDIEPGFDQGYIEYIESWLKNAHIVGVDQWLRSATLGRRIHSMTFFDLMNVNSETEVARRKKQRARQYGSLAMLLDYSRGKISLRETYAQPHSMLRALDNPYASPQSLVDTAKIVTGFEDRFDQPSGVWEGYTLGEHTETVLRNFDETYAENVPVSVLRTMRLAMIVHDIGKPLAVKDGRKSQQAEYNVREAKEFLRQIGADPSQSMMILGMIGEGEQLAHNLDVRKTPGSAEELKRFATEKMTFIYGSNVGEDRIQAYASMCRMLRVCDGGAYTSMAVTRNRDGTYYRNYPAFNNPKDPSRNHFRPSQGLGGRHLSPR